MERERVLLLYHNICIYLDFAPGWAPIMRGQMVKDPSLVKYSGLLCNRKAFINYSRIVGTRELTFHSSSYILHNVCFPFCVGSALPLDHICMYVLSTPFSTILYYVHMYGVIITWYNQCRIQLDLSVHILPFSYEQFVSSYGGRMYPLSSQSSFFWPKSTRE